jgi:uncharacterized protein YqgV (UPF0045/DUF77 family)
VNDQSIKESNKMSIGISAQVSLYPLGQDDLRAAIEGFWGALDDRGLEQERGPMSTLIWGDDETVFAALQDGFRRAAERGGTVMVVTLSNACPRPSV